MTLLQGRLAALITALQLCRHRLMIALRGSPALSLILGTETRKEFMEQGDRAQIIQCLFKSIFTLSS